MASLSNFVNGTQVRHEAYIKKRYISTLYGFINNGTIETDGLGSHLTFTNPMEFIKQHKIHKIHNRHRQTVCGNPWKIVEYFDGKVWKPLNEYVKPDSDISDSGSTLLDSADFIDTDDDCQSFITCVSETEEKKVPEILFQDDYPYLITFEPVNIWQTNLWIRKEYLEGWNIYQELEQDCRNMEEIEDEIAYEQFDKEYSWITRYNLPYEEELWIGLKIELPYFGEVWMTQSGECWEVDYTDKKNVGQWIGCWSWDTKIMDLTTKEPQDLVIDDEEFWDIIQDFDEPV